MEVLRIGMMVEKGGGGELLRMHTKSRFFNITVNPEHFTILHDNSPTATERHTMCSPQDNNYMEVLRIGMVVEKGGGPGR